MNLLEKKCIPCHSDKVKPLTKKQAETFLEQIPHWSLDEDGSMITRRFSFQDFIYTMSFVNHVAELAELEGHHPDMHIFYNHVDIDLWTHAIGGLHENDFILAAKINDILS